jgi:hypothetical protein
MEKRRPRGTAGDKTICLPIDEGIDYESLVENEREYRSYLEEKIDKYPELFPSGIKEGFRLHGFVTSKRQQIRTRRILLKANHEAYQIRPDFVTPYMSEKAEVAEKALYLRKHGLSYEGIAYILGRTEMHWYSLCQSLGRMSIVGTTVKGVTPLPPI